MTTIRKTLTRKSVKTFYRDGKKVTLRKTYRKVTRSPAEAALSVANAAQVASAPAPTPAPAPAVAAPAERVLLRKVWVRSYRRADGKKINVFKKTYRKAKAAAPARVLVRQYTVRRYRRADGKLMRVVRKVYRKAS